MKAKVILAGLFLLVLFAVTAPYAFGCAPDESQPGVCLPFTMPTPTRVVQIAIAAPPAPQPTPSGIDPEHAKVPMYVKPEYCIEAMCPGAVNAPPLNAPGGWDWLGPNSTVWYKMSDGHSLQLQLWVFANGQGGLTLDVFAPDQRDLYGSVPIGRGALNRNYPGSDLFYSGRSSAYGIWHARLTNHNAAGVSYSFRYTVTTPSLNNVCDNCHKAIGYDYNSCADPAFCQKLHDYADTNPQCYDHNIDQDLVGGCK